MKAPADLIHRMELVGASGIHDLREWRAVEALARHSGSATIAQLDVTARLTRHSVSAVVLALGHFTLTRFDPHPFVIIKGVNLSDLKTFTLPEDATVKLTAKGWMTAQLMGYGIPALIVPEGCMYAPEIAEPDADAHRHRLQVQHPLTHWTLQPAVPFHEA